MDNKRLGYLMAITGAVVVLGAGGLHFYSKYSVDKMVSDRVMYTSENTSKGVADTADLVESPEFSPVDADMKVEPVKTYQNVIEIPSCNITVPITPNIDRASLNAGAGHFPETAKMGEVGNTCYAGHYSTIYNCIFNTLPDIELYETVNGYNDKGEKTEYAVISKYVTTPDNISVLNQTEDTKDLTLVTCSENGTMRLIVQCRALSAEELDTFKKENEREKRDSMYSVADSIGSVKLLSYLEDGEKAEKKSYNLPASRHKDIEKSTEALLNK